MHVTLSRPARPATQMSPQIPGFEDHPLAKELDVTGRLRWIDELMERADLKDPSQSHARFFDEVRRRIDSRTCEPRLFLGVVGEFSSGKSTLINALLRHRLLRTDVLQGTTTAATLLSYGDDFAVTVVRKPGNLVARAARGVRNYVQGLVGLWRKKEPPTRHELLNLLHRCTSDDVFARDVQQVEVALPTETLRDGVVIVDTPGTNAVNPRHGEVTAAALRDLCDATLVAVPAEAAGAQSLLDYLRVHAADILHRCIFVVTKIDLLRRQRDRVQVLEALRAKLARELGIVDPIVLAAAPQFVVESLPSDAGWAGGEAATAGSAAGEGFAPEEIERWTAQFQRMEEELRPLLREKRLQAQADDIGKLLDRLYQRLSDVLGERLSDYRKRQEAMARVVIPDIDAFTSKLRDEHVRRAKEAIEKPYCRLGDELVEAATAELERMHASIEAASSRKELKDVLEQRLPSILSTTESRLRRTIGGAVAKMEKAAYAELKAFHATFQEQFRSLATLGGLLHADKSASVAIIRDAALASAGVATSLGGDVSQLLEEQGKRMFSGGAAGAIFGTMVLPGIGTLIGGLLGTVFSTLFGPSLDELKAHSWEQIKEKVCGALDESIPRAVDAVADSANALLERLGGAIDAYGPKYARLVEEMRARDAAEQAQLVRLQTSVARDLAEIDSQRAGLGELHTRICAFRLSAGVSSTMQALDRPVSESVRDNPS